jgi:protein TonB
MKKKKAKKDFIKNHEYAGGKNALKEIIAKNLIYPKNAIDNKIEGTVYLEYAVGFNGDVENVKVLKGIGYDCDEEAIRLVKLLKFSPQNNHGVKIITKHKIQINFKLPIEQKTVKTTISYNTIATKNNDAAEKKKTVYSYTIKF